jgi:hypothetical protein
MEHFFWAPESTLSHPFSQQETGDNSPENAGEFVSIGAREDHPLGG